MGNGEIITLWLESQRSEHTREAAAETRLSAEGTRSSIHPVGF
jgi:hypothetical protein